MNINDIECSLLKIVEFKQIDTIENVHDCIKFTMEFVENFKDLNGQQKNDIVINSITYIIKNNIEDGVKQEMLLDMLNPTIKIIIQI